MKKSTKILSLVLSVIMLFGVFSASTPVFAAEVNEFTSESKKETEIIENSEENTVIGEVSETESTDETEIVSEIEDMRTEYTKYFRMSDGSYMAAQYAQPVHFEKNGEWMEYDCSLTEVSNEKAFKIENSDSEISFPEEFKADDSAQIEVSARNYGIRFSPTVENRIFKKYKGEIKDCKELKSSKITEEITQGNPVDEKNDKNLKKLKIGNQKSAVAYSEIYSNVDIEYEISANQIKESIVLNKKQNKNKFEFVVDTDGLFPKKESDGSITLYADKECTQAVSSIAAPYMYDANGEYSYDVNMEIAEKKGSYVLTVNASNKWLNDKAREYPVVIDPTIILDVGRAKTYDCYVDNSQASTSFPYDYYLYAGYSSLGKTRTYIKFDLPELPDNCSIITNASIHFWQNSVDMGDGSTGYLNIYNVTKDWGNDRTVTWNAQPDFDSTVVDYCEFKSGFGAEYVFDITKSVKAWYEGSANYGLMLKSSDETKTKRTQLFSAENTGNNAYPVIQLTYRNNKGLESYWSYSSFSNGIAGTAHVNDYTGNLVYELPILSSISEIMPLTLTAYFNSYCANTKLCAGKNGSSKTTFGRGFRLNIQQTVLPSSAYGLTGNAASNYPYVYTDGDGTEHYIQKITEDGATVYKDEDGLNLTLEIGGECSYRIKDKLGNIKWFNSRGNLFKITDADNNEIHIYFKAANSSTGVEEKTKISYIIDGAGHKFTFEYKQNSDGTPIEYIESITDDAGRTVSTDTQSGHLEKVHYYDGTNAEIFYEDTDEGLINYVTSTDGYAINFDYTSKATGRRVSAVKEYGRNGDTFSKGQKVTFDRTQYNTTIMRSCGLDGCHNIDDSTKGADDIVTTMQFDNMGRTVSQQVSYGSGGEIGAGTYSYTESGGTSGFKNRVSESGGTETFAENLVYNGNCESTNSWTYAENKDSAVNGSGTATTANQYMGKGSLKLSATKISESNGRNYYRQTVSTITPGNSYTLSAYVKTDALTAYSSTTTTGAYLQITAFDSDGNSISGSSIKSSVIKEKTDTGINKGWRRLTVTVKTTSDTAYIRCYLVLCNVTGTAYYDCVQLENGTKATNYNMLENGSFEKHTSYAPTSWTAYGGFSVSTNSSGNVVNGSSNLDRKKGSRGLRVNGDAQTNSGMYQSVAVAPNANDIYIVSGWGKAYAVNDTWHENAKFEIAVRVSYDCKDAAGNVTTVHQYKDSAKFNTTISGWQFSSAVVPLKYKSSQSGCTYTPKSILVLPKYSYQENRAYFDCIQLVKDGASCYTYDKEGNLVSTAANSEQKVNMVYDKDNNMTSYTDTAGYKTTMAYDNHNLTLTTSAKGVYTRYNHDKKNNKKITEIRNASTNENATAAIRTETKYNGVKTADGVTIKAGAYKIATTDQNGKATSYIRDHKTGVLQSETNPKGTTTDYTYTPDWRLSKVQTGNTSVQYTYNEKKQLSKINFGGEEYSFTYDIFGNVVNTKVGNQSLSQNTYGSHNGVLTATEYGNGDKRRFAYNNLGQMTKVYTKDDSNSEVSAYSWNYTPSGSLLSHTDSVNNRKYLYDYDSTGRLIRSEINNKQTGANLGYIEQGYDKRNNVNKIVFSLGGKTRDQRYYYTEVNQSANSEKYAKDNLPTMFWLYSTRYETYEYDSINRLTQRKFTLDAPLYYNYIYKSSGRNKTGETKYRTTQLSKEFIGDDVYGYTYDSVGNIVSVSKGSRTDADPSSTGAGGFSAYRSYEYDDLGQLTRENNKTTNKTKVWNYDSIGNIESVSTYNYTTGDVGEKQTEIDYQYAKSYGWNKSLTGVDLDGDGTFSATETIEYDKIGNPTNYMGATLTWNGRQLTTYTKQGLGTVTYTYDSNGLRTTKTAGGVTTEYYYAGDKLIYEKRSDGTELYFYYNSYGLLSRIEHNGTNYYTATNMSGDVVAIYRHTGVLWATYEYDAWGNVISVKDANGDDITSQTHIANINPIRYRGYYYDTDTELYYLQSRYYNAKVGRFLNADGFISTGDGVLSYNMFAYCGNNPVMFSDPSGCFLQEALDWASQKWEEFKNWLKGEDSDEENNTLSSSGTRGRGNKNNNKKRKDSRKGSEKRQKSGSRERNVAHPNGEEHSRVPKGTYHFAKPDPFVGMAIATVSIVYIVSNDVTGVGVADDPLLVPFGALFWDSAAQLILT